MEIIHLSTTWEPRNGAYKSAIVLYDDNWNDYSYRTTFHMVYCDGNGKVIQIGYVKIYCYDIDEERTVNYSRPVANEIPHTIDHLDQERFCSLGQDLNYYKNLEKYLPHDYIDILKRICDLAFDKSLQDRFIDEKGVRVSLLRESSAEKALREAFLDKENIEIETEDKDMSFNYTTTLPYSDLESIFHFNFRRSETLPYRINILIGKNGTGKTEVLASLANSLSGISSSADERIRMFGEKRPSFDRVISISFSAFDKFRKRTASNHYESISYIYCGIQSEKGALSLNDLHSNLYSSLQTIKEKGRIESWKKVMSELIEKEHIELIEKIANDPNGDIHLSSGQHILICSITEALANIENESIILFDEPELHLHPNAIANTMRMFYTLLEEFNSYAIMATHSPLIIQETPSRFIQALTRIDNELIIREPDIECFGENITTITDDIFDVNISESCYKTVLKQLSDKYSIEEIIKLFEDKLSLNAMIFLKTCCRENN